MSEPFLAEIRMVGFNFAPRGWSFCDGQILPINQNQSLFSLLGTTYGGDGRTSFALPDLRGRTPIHVGDGYNQGQKTGVETVTLSAAEMGQHTHAVNVNSAPGNKNEVFGNFLGATGVNAYRADHNTAMSGSSLSFVGNGQAHNNMQPFLAINFCIALQGLFPPRN